MAEQDAINKAVAKKEINDLAVVWLHSLQAIAQAREGLRKFREIESTASKRWLKKSGFKFNKKKDAYEAALSYAEFFNKIFNDRKFEVRKVGEKIKVDMMGHNPYVDVYSRTQIKAMGVFSLRSANFVSCIKEMTNQNVRSHLTDFSHDEEHIELLPEKVGLGTAISIRLTKGTIRISEISATELGIDIIDKVIIKHAKTGKSITAQSYTSSKIPRGTIYLSRADAVTIGLKEGDKVQVEKAGREAIVQLVEEKEYANESAFE